MLSFRMCMVAGAMAAFFTTALAQPSLPRSVGGVRRSAGAGDSPPRQRGRIVSGRAHATQRAVWVRTDLGWRIRARLRRRPAATVHARSQRALLRRTRGTNAGPTIDDHR